MKYCPNCRRMSRDDDFCSHCGSAVYGDDDYSSPVDCGSIKGHSHDHEQVTYSAPHNIPDYETAEKIRAARAMMSESNQNRQMNGRKGSDAGCAAVMIVLFVMMALLMGIPVLVDLLDSL